MSAPNPPAFPSAGIVGATDERANQRDGMTLRDHFAGLAMQALISKCDMEASLYSSLSYGVADFMLQQRAK